MDYRTLILLLTACLQLLVGGFVYRKNPRSTVHRMLFLETFFMAVWSLLGAIIWMPAFAGDTAHTVFYGRLAHVFGLFCCAGFVSLGLVFPDGRTSAPLRLRVGVWVVGCVVALATFLSPDMVVTASVDADGKLHASYGSLRFAYWGFLALVLCWGLGDLGMRFARAQGMRRVQMQYLLAGLALTAGLNVPAEMVAPMLGLHSLGWTGPCFTLAFLGMVSHAIVRHRLMGIRLFVGRGFADMLAVGLAGVVFLVLMRAIDWAMGASHESTALTPVALAIALLFQPLRNRVHAGVSRYFYRPPYDYQSTVRDTSRELAGTLDLDRALGYLLRMVVQTLQVERGLVLIRERPSQAFRVRAVQQGWAESDDRLAAGVGLAAQSPLITALEASRELVVVDELEQVMSPEQASTIAEELRHFGAAVAVPMFSGNLLVALLLVGPKLSGDVFASQDIDLLSTLGAEGAAAIANAQLHQEAMQAERLATLGGLAAGIAHEVKNPLVAVRTFAELLPDNYGDREFREDFSRVVLREVERIDHLIAQLLNYARPAPPLLGPVDLNAVIRETLQLLGYELTRHNITCEQHCHRDLPAVKADASQLRQVVLNISLNAIQVMPTGGTLRVTTRLMEARGERASVPFLLPTEATVEMEIANSGPPIPEGHLDRVFEPFFSTRNGGTGLGLSICKRIVTEHQGSIRVSRTQDGLMAFLVRLPVAEAAATEEPDVIRVEPADDAAVPYRG